MSPEEVALNQWKVDHIQQMSLNETWMNYEEEVEKDPQASCGGQQPQYM